MARTLLPYVIKNGDYLSKLAFARGFDMDEVWNDPKNADIRKLRKPDVLCAGDIVYLPSDPPPGLPFQKRTANRFVATVPTMKCSVGFNDDKGPFANEPFTSTIQGVDTDGTTDANGRIDLEVPATCHDVLIYFPKRAYATHVRLGHLDPIEEPTGVWQRLRRLGYLQRAPSGNEDADAQTLANALGAFQTEQKIDVTKKFDDATKAKLVAAHGS